MKKIIVMVLAVTSLFFLTVSNTLADWSVGVSLGSGVYEADGTETEDGEVNFATAEEKKFTYPSIFVEYDTGMVSFGLDYIPGTVETEESARTDYNCTPLCTGNDGGSTGLTNTVKVGFSQHLTLYAVVPIMDTGAFIRAGVIRVDVETRELLNTGSTYPDADVFGGTLSLGYQHDLDWGFVRAEAGHTEYETITVTSNNNHKVDADVNGNWGKISIGKSF